MTFTYSGTSLTSNLAKVRLAIGDTTSGAGVKPDGSNFTDEELDVFISAAIVSGTWRNAVAPVLRVLANQYAAAARSTQVADISEDLTRTADALRQQAADWEASVTAAGAQAGGGFATGVVTYDTFVYEVSTTGAVT